MYDKEKCVSVESLQEDFTLESILQLKDEKYINFTIYLQHTYCIENLYFWQDVQAYRLEPTLDKYNDMIQTYITTNAPYEINIPCDMKEYLLNVWSPDCFNDAAETILELIRINSFLPWYHTIYTLEQPLNQHRNSFVSSSFQERWNMFHISRPSFSSLRSPSSFSTTSSCRSLSDRLTHLFQRKKNSLVFKFKNKYHEKTNELSWLAKK